MTFLVNFGLKFVVISTMPYLALLFSQQCMELLVRYTTIKHHLKINWKDIKNVFSLVAIHAEL